MRALLLIQICQEPREIFREAVARRAVIEATEVFALYATLKDWLSTLQPLVLLGAKNVDSESHCFQTASLRKEMAFFLPKM
ncbi:Hypothetical predicted protein [Cloeon dipterum]|uniref:Uncharacterized protein n=1 Tax=Cloeon dipterum TaxID=197152 RepID=A0A8S1DSH3_9INSE|nr:Hypothetical predicted protein [Cloeon dipterum]